LLVISAPFFGRRRDMANNKQQKKVIIGMPSEDIMHVTTAHSIGCAVIGTPEVVDFLIYKGCDIVSARTWLAKEAIAQGATHLLFVDTDMHFPPDTIRKLLSLEKDIVSVNYHKRRFPLESVLTQLPESEENEDEPYRVGVAGTGLMLIDLKVFTEGKLEDPWFSFGRGPQGELKLGEDAWFCYTARSAGYEVWVDPTINVRHIGEYAF
jgi:hypothetical protein